MAVQVSYPGVYIEEIPSTSHTVTSATTSATAFVGFFPQGPIGQAVKVSNFEDFTRTFGGLNQRSEASYGIFQYFNNGGQIAWVVRLGDGKQRAATVSVDVHQPKLESLSQQASDAAEAAQKAADQAQADMTEDDEPWQVAEDVATQTQTASDETRKAADAANAAAQELQLQLDQYEAESGGEAESTLAAAEEAALAAEDAADAADAASAAAAAAEKAAGLLATAPTFAAAQEAAKDTQSAIEQTFDEASSNVDANSDLSSLESGGTIDYGSLQGAVAKVGQDATAAKSSSPELADSLDAVLSATNQMLLDGLQASQSALTAKTSAAEAVTLANHNVLTPPYADQVNDDVADAQTAAGTALTQAEALVDAVADAVASASPPASLDSLQTDAELVLEYAQLSAAWAQVAAAGSAGLQQAAGVGEEVSDAAFQSAAQSTAKAASAAANAGSVLYPSSPPADVSNLEAAADTFEKAASQSPSTAELSDAQSDLNNAATDGNDALQGLTGSPPAGSPPDEDSLQETADWAASTLTAKLAGLVTIDLQNAAQPIDAVEKRIQEASDAAANAAALAQVAAAKAAVADQAAQQDEAAAEGEVLEIDAANPGVWGNSLQVTITSPQSGYTFTMKVEQMGLRSGKVQAINSETYTSLTLDDPTDPSYAPAVVNAASQLVQISYDGPNVNGAYPKPKEPGPQKLQGGKDGGPPQANNLFPVEESDGPGLEAPLNNIAPNVFNILCLPVVATYPANEMSSALTQAQEYVETQHAFLLADIPSSVDSVSKMQSWMNTYGNATAYYAAVYYPRLQIPDPLQSYRLRNVGPSGTIAGVYARNDLAYGVWTTPAGTNAVLQGAQIVSNMTDADNGTLNQLGVNCLRNFAVYGNLVWGGRTMAGADLLDSEWKYVNVRRTADFIEQSLFQSLKWAVFQDNDSRLWSQITSEVGSFMSGLFTQGAFAGSSASQAYLVKCDSTTTTQTDIDNGIVNILVGFAPEKPAEFVIIQLEQLAGQSPS